MTSKLLRYLGISFVLLVGFYLRLGHLKEVYALMPEATILCGDDAYSYHGNAQAALLGEWPGNRVFGLVPLYSFYLYFIYLFFGTNYVIPLIVQILFNLLSCTAVYYLGKTAFSPLTGWLAMIAVTLYGPPLSYQICYAQVALTVPLLILTLSFLVMFYRRQHILYLVAAGFMLGVCALSRPTMLILVPTICFWFFWERKSWGHFLQKCMYFTIAVVVVITPLTIHNYQVSGKFILISDQGAINLYFGNNLFTSGIGPHGVSDQFTQRLGNQQYVFDSEYQKLSQQVEGGKTTYLTHTINYISTYPQDWVKLMLRKIALMFFEPDWRLILTSFVYPLSSTALKESRYLTLLPIEWLTLVICAFLSLIFVRNRHVVFLWLITLATSAVIIAFFVKFRFRLPLVPLLLLLTMVFVAESRRMPKLKFLVSLIILLILFPIEPTLLLIIILFMAVRLYPHNKQVSVWQHRWLLSAVGSYLITMSYIIQMVATHQADTQTQNYYVGPAIFGPILIGQTFVPNCNGLNEIQVELSTVNFESIPAYTFTLVQGLNLDDVIYTERFKVEKPNRWMRQTFLFSPQTASEGQTYYFYIQAPDATFDNSLTVRLNADLPTIYKRYEPGSLYGGMVGNLQPFPADLAFAVHCQESTMQLFTRTVQRLAVNLSLPEMFFYATFIFSTVLLLISLFKLTVDTRQS